MKNTDLCIYVGHCVSGGVYLDMVYQHGTVRIWRDRVESRILEEWKRLLTQGFHHVDLITLIYGTKSEQLEDIITALYTHFIPYATIPLDKVKTIFEEVRDL